MKKIKKVIIGIVIGLLVLMPMNVAAANGSGAYIKAVYDMINYMYQGDMDNPQTYENMVRAMFGSLDDYTKYYNLEEAEDLFNRLGNSFSGIGVVITVLEEGLTIVDFVETSPAKQAGLMKGDVIVTVDGTDISNMNATEASSLIKGDNGSKVTLEVKRKNRNETLTFEVKRKNIKINPVSYKILNDDIGYIKIQTFSFDADKHFDKVMSEMNSKGITKIILDLRNNGGGSVAAAVNVARHFIPGGTISTLDYKAEDVQDKVYTSSLKENPYDLVVLVNGLTASASELIAGAVRDTLCGYVVGVQTYGKSVFQQLLPVVNYEYFKEVFVRTEAPLINYYDIMKHGLLLPKSSVMGYVKLTVGEYLTPYGRKINNIGVRPMKLIINDKYKNDVNINNIVSLYNVKAYDKGDRSAEIFRSKFIFKAMGYDISTSTDKFDQTMFNTVKKFQVENDLAVTGDLNIKTQKRLNAKVNKIHFKADKQLLKAIDILEN